MISHASARARWTLISAAVGSVLLLGLTVLWVRSGAEESPLSYAEPWQPPSIRPTLSAEPDDWAIVPAPEQSAAAPTRPPASPPPTTGPPAKQTSPAPPVGPNLSLRADGEADGSTKAQGRSFKDVRDGDLSTFWSPVGVTGEISNKWLVPVTVGRIRILEAPGGGRIEAWQVRNHDNDAVLASGNGAGESTFAPVTLRKITFVILGAGGTPRVAEYETFAR